ncbi:MAG: chemotaxis protein CheA [Immundisolibacteraceae bacterium]|nr:chemotaxis protein CheA [Immundisolibacteraceae bacterium]
MDEELLEDFLLEAGELVDLLGQQLVELEETPEDSDLLNAVFRAFHTIKGGASFLALDTLIRVCHSAENVFDTLRNGGRKLTPDLMDSVLEGLDVVVLMFEQLNARESLTAASDELIVRLDKYALPASADKAVTDEKEQAGTATDDALIDDDEFESMLDQLQGGDSEQSAPESTAGTESKPGSDQISDDEFESLLDDIHGGPGGGDPAPVSAAWADQNDKEITVDEFEALLDELHPIETADGTTVAVSSVEANLQAAESAEAMPAIESGDGALERNLSDVTDEELAALKTEISKPAPISTVVVKEEVPTGMAQGPEGTLIQERRKTPRKEAGESNMRVETQILDDIMNMVGELVLVRNRLSNLIAKSSDEELTKTVRTLNLVTSQLQDSAMKTRMQQIRKVFGRFPRVVRDLARTLNKDIRLELIGEDTDLDKNLVDALADPLIHLVRNSVDHGIESPEVREAAGKSPQGLVTLSAGQEGDRIAISIQDDGAGMDVNRLRAVAVERGVMSQEEAARLSERETYDLIFAPGFSSKAEVTEVSGRGVGMDVVKTAISQLSGSIEIESSIGVGSTITIRVPLTLAIVGSLMIGVGERLFALPIAVVDEIFSFDPTNSKIVDGQRVVVRKDEVLPFFVLGNWLLSSVGDAPKEQYVVVVSVGSKRMGLLVDRLLGQEDVVIKPLGPELQDIGGFAGATINGDGRMALIIDVPGLIRNYA